MNINLKDFNEIYEKTPKYHDVNNRIIAHLFKNKDKSIDYFLRSLPYDLLHLLPMQIDQHNEIRKMDLALSVIYIMILEKNSVSVDSDINGEILEKYHNHLASAALMEIARRHLVIEKNKLNDTWDLFKPIEYSINIDKLLLFWNKDFHYEVENNKSDNYTSILKCIRDSLSEGDKKAIEAINDFIDAREHKEDPDYLFKICEKIFSRLEVEDQMAAIKDIEKLFNIKKEFDA